MGRLLEFMKSYFDYLTNDQAMRYLYFASYDLLLAIRLVHHERGLPLPPSLLHDDGGNGKIKIALRMSVLEVDYPKPNDLVQIMTAKYPSHLLSPIMDKLTGSDLQLTTHDVRRIEDLLKTAQCLPPNRDLLCCCCSCLPNVTENHVQQLQYISDMTFNTPAMEGSSAQVRYDDNDDDSPPCEHILSINMCLLDAINCFYIRALAALPLPAAGADADDDSTMRRSCLLHAFVISSHCYGPLDPLSNIIVNTVWYNIACPHLSSDQDNDEVKLIQDFFDTDDISQLVSDSRCGLVALLHAINGTSLSKHDAMEYLWFRQCDLTLELQQIVMTTKKNPYDAAVKTLKQYTLLGKFLKSFSDKKLDSLRCLMDPFMMTPHVSSPMLIGRN
uniref:PIR2-like helical domain-containing protein n=1 Tax=Leersia perrieri TaxID=77586 RepID=A0A0D9XYJ0_9ORYZ